MKRFFLLLNLVIFLCLSIVVQGVHAADIGGTGTVGQGNLGLSAYQDSILGRDGKYTRGIETGPNETMEMVSDTKINRTMIKCSYGLFDWLDFYAMAGASDFKSNIDATIGNSSGQTLEGKFKINGNHGFTYGLGMKAEKEFENPAWILGCDFRYLEQRNDFDGTFGMAMNGVSYEESINGDATFREGHFAPYLAKEIWNLVPYFGVKFSNVWTEYNLEWENGESDTCKFSAKNNVGMFLGIDWELNDAWSLNLEGRLIDEQAVSVAINYKF